MTLPDEMYTAEFFDEKTEGAVRSAKAIVPLVLELVGPKSVVDVGCGTGAWLGVFEKHGISDVLGIDGNYVERDHLEIPAYEFRALDLREPFTLTREFDLVVCLEVAEHLPAECAPAFIGSLTRLGPVVLFSAAIPGQGGRNHVNEQWPDYWAAQFEQHGYVAADVIRPRVWSDPTVEFWYAQNTLVFVRRTELYRYPRLQEAVTETRATPLALVHPQLFALRTQDPVPPEASGEPQPEASASEPASTDGAFVPDAAPAASEARTTEPTDEPVELRPPLTDVEPFTDVPPTAERNGHPARASGLRVLIISPFPPDPAPEANHALHMSENLARAGLTVDVLCQEGGIQPDGVTVHPVARDWSWRDVPRIAKCMRASGPDVVLLVYLGWIYRYESAITFLPTICKAILPGVPFVTQFEAIDEPPRRSLLVRTVRNALELTAGVHSILGTLLRASTRIITLSTPHRARLALHHPSVAEKTSIVPPPPLIRMCPDDPATARKQARAAIGAAPDDFVWVYFGYIYPGKGVEILLRAFATAYRRIPRLRLVLVGGTLDFPREPMSCSEYFEIVQRLPEQLGIADRVTWTGGFTWDSDEASRYLHAGDACVLPFDYGVTLNNSSLAAASRHGLPVVSTELAQGRDETLEHGRNIYLCQPRDPEHLAEALELITTVDSLRERLRSGIRALERQWYSPESATMRLVDVLESTVSRREPLADPVPPRVLTVRGRYDRPNGQRRQIVFRNDAASRPLVSIVVAAHNVAEYLSLCLDSLVHQTLRNIEIIVVNDASTDETADIIEEYVARYPNVHAVACKSNKGLASVRNIGMSIARGEYVGFLDGDDWADVRMCERMYGRAAADDADVLIGSAKVFYEDSKTFAPLFDHHVREGLSPELRERPFRVSADPGVIMVEPVAWTKLYKRAFLEKHRLRFESGMNSYEDMCFHFSALLQAERIVLTDDPNIYYRQNRPGQISGRTDRRVFEVFEVFDRIHANLTSWGVSADVWGMFVKVQLKQFDWLLGSRVAPGQKREFLTAVAAQLQKIPEAGFGRFARQASPDDLAKLRSLRANRLGDYERLGRAPLFQRVQIALRSSRRSVAKRMYRRSVAMLKRRLKPGTQLVVTKLLAIAGVTEQLRALQDGVAQLNAIKASTPRTAQTVVEVCRVEKMMLVLSHPPEKGGLGDAVWRTESDFYMTQLAAFREGDVVIDVGAHVGVHAIYLAKRYPFLRVYAVEADPGNYECLRQNIVLNEVNNVVAINKAVCGDSRGRRLYSSPWDSAWATVDVKTACSQRLLHATDVESTSLDELFRDHAIEHCRVLRLSARGAVAETLRGLTRNGCIDLLCGDVDLGDCSRVRLEMESGRLARQCFWRTTSSRNGWTTHSWVHQLPRGCEVDAAKARDEGRNGASPRDADDPRDSFDPQTGIHTNGETRPTDDA